MKREIGTVEFEGSDFSVEAACFMRAQSAFALLGQPTLQGKAERKSKAACVFNSNSGAT